MNKGLGWFGTSFFVIVALAAMVMKSKKAEPQKAFPPIIVGGLSLSVVMFLNSVGWDWGDLDRFYYSVVVCSLMFLGGVAWFGFYHLKRKDEGPKR